MIKEEGKCPLHAPSLNHDHNYSKKVHRFVFIFKEYSVEFNQYNFVYSWCVFVYRKSASARTLLLDPATSIAELACTLLLYLAVSFCCACHLACCICSAWVSCHYLLFILLPPASVTKTQKSVTFLKKSPKSDACILIIIKVGILQQYGGFVGWETPPSEG